MGFIGAVGISSFVYYLNASYGFDRAIIPALKQFFYTFLIGGSLVRISENLSVSYDNRALSLFLAVLVTTAITATFLTVIHLMKGTPNPYATIFWTTITAPPGFFFVAFLKRRKHDKYAED